MERGARKIALTNEGSLLLRRAEELVALADTEQEFVSQNERLEGRISIGSGELAAGTVLARCCEAFHAQYPLVAFDLLTANADVVKEQMDKGLLDVGLLLEPVDMDKYDYIRLPEREEWGVLMRPDVALAGRKCLTAEEPSGAAADSAQAPQRTKRVGQLVWQRLFTAEHLFHQQSEHQLLPDGQAGAGVCHCDSRVAASVG